MGSSTPSAVQAASAASFTSSIGINTHIDFAWTAYGNLTNVQAALNYLGIENVRDSPGTSSDLTWWQQVAQATGVRFDAFIGETSPAGYSAQLSLMQQLAGKGLLNALEGGNEPDQPYAQSQGTSTTFAAQFQQQVWALGQSLNVPVIQTSFGMVSDYGSTGSLSAWANYGNAHTYFGTGNNPGTPAYWSGVSYPNGTMQWLNAEAQLTTPGKPVITTESGYYTTSSSTDPTSVSETVQAKYTLDILMDGFKNGDAKTYLYELLDQKTGDGYSEDNFGLFHSDGTAKLAAVGVHDLMTLLADNGSGGFIPGSLSYSLSGLQSTDNSFLLQKSDGSYWLALWNDTRLSGPTSPTDIVVPPHTVTLTLGSPAASIDVFDPLIGTNAVASASNAGSMAINLPDHPILIEITGNGTAAPAPNPAPTPTPSPAPNPSPTPAPTPTGPLLTMPASETTTAGTTSAVTGVSITDVFAANNPGTMVLNLAATSGTLRMTDANGVAVAGSGAHAMSITGTLAQLNADLANLSYIAASTSGSDGIMVDVWDQAGMESTKTIAVTVIAPMPVPTPAPTPTAASPSIAVPAGESVTTGSTTAISGVSITDAFAATNPGTMALNLTSQSGTLRMKDANGNLLAGSGTHAISITGTLAQLNADLTRLSYIAGSNTGSDKVSVDVWDQAGIEATRSIAVSITAPANTGPSITLPAAESVPVGRTATITGISITDPYAASHPGSMALNLSAGSGTLRMTDANGNLIAGSGTHAISVSGTLAQVNADLAHLTYATGASAGSDSITVDIWDQLGLEATQSLAVTVNQPTNAAAMMTTTAPMAIAPTTETVTVDANNTTINATAGDHVLLIGGSFDVITAVGGTETVLSTGASNQITTGAGDDWVRIGGTQTVVDSGSGHNVIQDYGGGNRLILPAAGQGYDEIYGNVLTNHDLLDFRPLLAGTQWDGQSNLNAFLQLRTVNGTDTVVGVTPSGVAGGASTDVATLHGAGALTLSTLLQHAVV